MPFTKSKSPKVNAYLKAVEEHPLAELFFEIRKTVLGKKHITLIFFDGVALKDAKGLLEGDGTKTRSARFDALPLPEKALSDLVKQAAKASGT